MKLKAPPSFVILWSLYINWELHFLSLFTNFWFKHIMYHNAIFSHCLFLQLISNPPNRNPDDASFLSWIPSWITIMLLLQGGCQAGPGSASWTAWTHLPGPGPASPHDPWLWRKLFRPTAQPCHRVPDIWYCLLYSRFSSSGLWTIVCGVLFYFVLFWGFFVCVFFGCVWGWGDCQSAFRTQLCGRCSVLGAL